MGAGVLDAGVAIGWIRRGHRRQDEIDRLYVACRDGGMSLQISAVNLAEVIIHTEEVTRLSGVDTVATLKAFRIQIHQPDEAVARRVARLHSAHGISLADGFAAATALELGARLHTTDAELVRQLRRTRVAVTHY